MEFEAQYIVLFGRLQIRYYGIIIVVAMLVAATVAARLAKRDRRDPDHIWGALTWAIIPAIIGARLFFVLFPPQSLVSQGRDTAWFLANFFNAQDGAIAIWSGGLNIFGAIIGGALGAWLYFSKYHGQVAWFFSAIVFVVFYPLVFLWSLARYVYRERGKPYNLPKVWELTVQKPADIPQSIIPWLDLAGVSIPLGQAIGRWANFVNQELYGIPTTLPWGIEIPAAARVEPYRSLVDYPLTTTFHPLFLYESIWNLLAFVVLLNLFLRSRRLLRTGDFFLLFVMQYCVIRFLLEFIRVEVTVIGGINLWQAVSAVGFVVALVIFLLRRNQKPATTPNSTTSAA